MSCAKFWSDHMTICMTGKSNFGVVFLIEVEKNLSEMAQWFKCPGPNSTWVYAATELTDKQDPLLLVPKWLNRTLHSSRNSCMGYPMILWSQECFIKVAPNFKWCISRPSQYLTSKETAVKLFLWTLNIDFESISISCLTIPNILSISSPKITASTAALTVYFFHHDIASSSV